jgi:hypothetical protein
VRVNGNPGLRVTAVIAGEFGGDEPARQAGRKKPRAWRGFQGPDRSDLMLSASCEQFQPAQPTQSRAIRECPAQARL